MKTTFAIIKFFLYTIHLRNRILGCHLVCFYHHLRSRSSFINDAIRLTDSQLEDCYVRLITLLNASYKTRRAIFFLFIELWYDVTHDILLYLIVSRIIVPVSIWLDHAPTHTERKQLRLAYYRVNQARKRYRQICQDLAGWNNTESEHSM